jgi:hypothetical protein
VLGTGDHPDGHPQGLRSGALHALDGGREAIGQDLGARRRLFAEWLALGTVPSVDSLICAPVSELSVTLAPVTGG